MWCVVHVVGTVAEQSQPEGTVCVHVKCTFDQAKSRNHDKQLAECGSGEHLNTFGVVVQVQVWPHGDTRVLTGCVACSGFLLQCCNGNSSIETRMCGIAARSRDRTCGTDSMLQQVRASEKDCR